MSRHPAHPSPDARPALVTGASSGIGRATAIGLAGLRHPVAVAARRVERLAEVVDEIESAGGRAVAVALDLADEASITDAVDKTIADLGPVEMFVSVAGEVLPQKAHEVSPADFAHQLQVNLLGVQSLVSRLVPPMIERRRGDVVLVSSDVTRVPRPTMSGYVSSKWGVEGLARAMQLELEGTGVRASLVRPGPTRTEMGSEFPPEILGDLMEEWSSFGLMRHHGYLDPEGVAMAVNAVVSAPRGTHFTIIEVEPEAPVKTSAPDPEPTSPEPTGTEQASTEQTSREEGTR